MPDALFPALHTLTCHYHDSVTVVLRMHHHQNNIWSVEVLWWSLTVTVNLQKCTLTICTPDDEGGKYFSNCASLLYLSITLLYFSIIEIDNLYSYLKSFARTKCFLRLTFFIYTSKVDITNHNGLYFFFFSIQPMNKMYAVYQGNGPGLASSHISLDY